MTSFTLSKNQRLIENVNLHMGNLDLIFTCKSFKYFFAKTNNDKKKRNFIASILLLLCIFTVSFLSLFYNTSMDLVGALLESPRPFGRI